MIKIPLSKYKNSKMDLVHEHFNSVKNYIIDVIQFYINCCDIIDKMNKGSNKLKDEYKKYNYKLENANNITTLKSLITVLSNEKFEDKNHHTGIINIEDVFKKGKIKVNGRS